MLYIIAISIFTIVYLCILLFMLYMLYAIVSGAPFVPSKQVMVEEMLKVAYVQKNECVIDLGSGDGRIVCAAAPLCLMSAGVEISPVLYLISKWKVWRKGLTNVVLMRDSLWNIDLSRYDVVFIYFIPHWMNKLEKKIKKEMKSGSRIISHAFAFTNWQEEKKCGTIRVYKV